MITPAEALEKARRSDESRLEVDLDIVDQHIRDAAYHGRRSVMIPASTLWFPSAVVRRLITEGFTARLSGWWLWRSVKVSW